MEKVRSSLENGMNICSNIFLWSGYIAAVGGVIFVKIGTTSSSSKLNNVFIDLDSVVGTKKASHSAGLIVANA
jgi:hypothetical protein